MGSAASQHNHTGKQVSSREPTEDTLTKFKAYHMDRQEDRAAPDRWLCIPSGSDVPCSTPGATNSALSGVLWMSSEHDSNSAAKGRFSSMSSSSIPNCLFSPHAWVCSMQPGMFSGSFSCSSSQRSTLPASCVVGSECGLLLRLLLRLTFKCDEILLPGSRETNPSCGL